VTLVPLDQKIRITARPPAALAKSVEGKEGLEHH
jgi:hypothetical protein